MPRGLVCGPAGRSSGLTCRPCAIPRRISLVVLLGCRRRSRSALLLQRTLGYPRWLALWSDEGDPNFRWDDGEGEVAKPDVSSIGRQLSAPCSPAKAEAQTGSPPSRGNMLWFEAIPVLNPPPRRRPGPSWGTVMISAVLRYLGLPNWAPASAGVAFVGAGSGNQRSPAAGCVSVRPPPRCLKPVPRRRPSASGRTPRARCAAYPTR